MKVQSNMIRDMYVALSVQQSGDISHRKVDDFHCGSLKK